MCDSAVWGFRTKTTLTEIKCYTVLSISEHTHAKVDKKREIEKNIVWKLILMP